VNLSVAVKIPEVGESISEVAIGEWRHSETDVTHNLPVNGGVIGRLEETTTRRERTMQANLLARVVC